MVIIELELASKSPIRNRRGRREPEKNPRSPVRFLLELRFRFERQGRTKNKRETCRIQKGQQKEGPSGSMIRSTFSPRGRIVPWSVFLHPKLAAIKR